MFLNIADDYLAVAIEIPIFEESDFIDSISISNVPDYISIGSSIDDFLNSMTSPDFSGDFEITYMNIVTFDASGELDGTTDIYFEEGTKYYLGLGLAAPDGSMFSETCEIEVEGGKIVFSNVAESQLWMAIELTVLGDINGDASVTNADVLMIYRYIYDSVKYPLNIMAADVDGDGNVTNADVLMIYRYIYDPVKYPLA